MDIYFSADIETDGSIPGPFSILSFAMIYAGAFDGETFYRPPTYDDQFYIELKPISDRFEPEALLTDHVRDRSGEMRDLIVLANSVDDQFAAMATAGVSDQLQ